MNDSRGSGGADSTKLPEAECVHALKGQALLRVSHSDEIALAGCSRRLHTTRSAALVLFAHAAVTVAKNK
jgi:hypothetical protein